jgi:uncharacterized protein YjaG (DUF416 family)
MVISMWKFEEGLLAADLGRIAKAGRVAFAAACAERLLPAYHRYAERGARGEELGAILDRLWDDLLGTPMTDAEVRAKEEACMALISAEEDVSWAEERAVAEDGVAAVAYALRCRLNGDAKEAAWAGRRAYEAMDHFVVTRESVNTNRGGAERRILEHPLVQTELERQRRDIDELLRTSDARLRDATMLLRERAKREAALPVERS